LFDIIAGTSIGAINSAVLMGHYLIETLTTSAKHKANSLASIHVLFNKEQSWSIAFGSIGIYYRWQTKEYAAKTN
jgi:predicted acylesterase/phospholipase RssA